METDEKKVKNDLKERFDIYKIFVKEVQSTESFLFQLKIGLGSMIIAIFVLVFSDIQNIQLSSSLFKISFLIIISSVIILFVEEVYGDMKEKIKASEKTKIDAILSNIRYHCFLLKRDPNNLKFLKIGAEAEKRLNDNVDISNDIKEGLTVDEI